MLPSRKRSADSSVFASWADGPSAGIRLPIAASAEFLRNSLRVIPVPAMRRYSFHPGCLIETDYPSSAEIARESLSLLSGIGIRKCHPIIRTRSPPRFPESPSVGSRNWGNSNCSPPVTGLSSVIEIGRFRDNHVRWQSYDRSTWNTGRKPPETQEKEESP